MGIAALIVVAVLQSGSPQASPVVQTQADAREAARRVAAVAHMAAQEYASGWAGGRLIAPEEADEARGFLTEARGSAGALGDLAREVTRRLDALAALIGRGAAPDSVAASAAALERLLEGRFGASLEERPAREPSLADGERIYAEHCTQCHGGLGRGDGPAAKGLSPPPADLTLRTATGPLPADYYRRVTYGTPGTAMPAFGSVLTADQRWDVIAHVLTLSDSMSRRAGNATAALAFATVRGTLGGAMEKARRGDERAASDAVFDAYLAFEAVEGPVRVADAGLASRAERRFAALREAASVRALTLDDQYVELLATLDSSEAALTAPHTGWGLLAESFLLIVREGFEAILIVGAIMAVVLHAGTPKQRTSVRWGIALALAASLATAALLDRLVAGAVAQREALEGGVMLVAAAVLFYVSYWLFSKVDARIWQRFVKEKIERAAVSGSAFALASVAFLAVYREGFETVLFYKALYVTGGGGGAAPITFGLAAGAVVLVAVYVGIERFGIRIPLRPFFAVTGATLYFMAFVFAGDGVKELQEGAIVPTTLIPGAPRWEFFGIYPTVESLALQGLVFLGLVIAVVWWLRQRRRGDAAVESTAPNVRKAR